MNFLRSIAAGFAGIFVGVLLSHLTDFALEYNGILPHGNIYVAAWLIWVVLAYRTVYMILGCYVTAALAPNYPMRHALAVGGLGVVACVAGAVATANMNLGPAWYPWTLALLSIPSGYVGGWLYVRGRS